ncbi:MAG: UDP-N-acetylmuramoyl-tripeptide--D-alanyl-D-alanine ligase [Candidatus Omnitrophica bacterium]|nr:UDP-N-acetylmuramoyl-tripeptide--D-alanyl-D-alanine ligase [Candidatus Omnitrophota bacterium]
MFTIGEIAKATAGEIIEGQAETQIKGVSIDSRTLKQGELFVAIKGERFNGHSFVEQARSKKAKAILISDIRFVANKKNSGNSNAIAIIKVKDTVRALGALAHWHRMKFRIPLIAVTGSNGKTTTKEMISALLKNKFNVLYNQGTQNNHIGVPLTLFRLRRKHSACVLEMGANHPGEIDTLSWIAQPTLAVITNIGPTHLEFFKTLQGVLKAKIEMINNLAKNGKLIVNKDDRFLFNLADRPVRTITFGVNQYADYSAEITGQTKKGTSFLLNRRHQLTLKALGRHNVYNALASIACARNFGLGYNVIKDTLVSFKAPPMRMQVLDVKGIRFVVDCYNSNPQSLKCALDFLKDSTVAGNKIAICGDMLELGKRSQSYHFEIGRKVAQDKIDFLITLGRSARYITSGASAAGMPKTKIYDCYDCREIADILRKVGGPGDMVLLKGSRAMKMENILECFTGSFTR